MHPAGFSPERRGADLAAPPAAPGCQLLMAGTRANRASFSLVYSAREKALARNGGPTTHPSQKIRAALSSGAVMAGDGRFGRSSPQLFLKRADEAEGNARAT